MVSKRRRSALRRAGTESLAVPSSTANSMACGASPGETWRYANTMSSTATTLTTAAATIVSVEELAVRSDHQVEPFQVRSVLVASAAWRTSAAPHRSSETTPATMAMTRATGVTAGTSRAA